MNIRVERQKTLTILRTQIDNEVKSKNRTLLVVTNLEWLLHFASANFTSEATKNDSLRDFFLTLEHGLGEPLELLEVDELDHPGGLDEALLGLLVVGVLLQGRGVLGDLKVSGEEIRLVKVNLYRFLKGPNCEMGHTLVFGFDFG